MSSAEDLGVEVTIGLAGHSSDIRLTAYFNSLITSEIDMFRGKASGIQTVQKLEKTRRQSCSTRCRRLAQLTRWGAVAGLDPGNIFVAGIGSDQRKRPEAGERGSGGGGWSISRAKVMCYWHPGGPQNSPLT